MLSTEPTHPLSWIDHVGPDGAATEMYSEDYLTVPCLSLSLSLPLSLFVIAEPYASTPSCFKPLN